ncbi:MAG: DNA polymerase I [Anaerolineae bacterium]|nr:DNA polymerase I [Anaerolineae bacterium]
MTNTRGKRLVLIDGHALAYRMYYVPAINKLTTRRGEPTNAVYGFTRALLAVIGEDNPPDYLAVSFDTGATFRDAMYPDYKGTRERMPDRLQVQMGRIHQVLEALNIPVLEIDGYEADDVLGTAARLAAQEGVHTTIITGDRDLLQLVDEKTTVELPASKGGAPQLYDIEAVKAKYGLLPTQIVDLKALMGDSSDNIPGVAGIGEKTAIDLLQQYKTVDELYEHLDDIPQKRPRTALKKGREMAEMSYKLAQIVTEAPIDFDLEACLLREYDLDKVRGLFQELEFRTFLKQLTGGGVGAGEPVPGQQLSFFADAAQQVETSTEGEEQHITTTHIIQDETSLDDLIDKLEAASAIAFDTETTSTDQMQADLVGISLAIQEGEGYYIPVGHTLPGSRQLPLEQVIDRLQSVMTDPNVPKIGHNIKYDAIVLSQHGLDVAPLSFDTMIGEWLVRPDVARGKLGLKNQAFIRLGVTMTEISELIGKGKDQITMAQVSIERAAAYAAADADITLRLYNLIKDEIAEQSLEKLFYDVEMPLVPVLAAMEQTGVLLDIDLLGRLSTQVGETLSDLTSQIYHIVGHEFNLNSTQQLSQALFEELRLPAQGIRKTSSGRYSTAADVLDALRDQDTTGVIEALLQYRELEKLRSTYLDALPVMVNPHTGRIHSSFNQTGVVTGRLSSSDPNLQNIPIRTDLGRLVRNAFIAAPGRQLVVADYSQVELRVMAHFSGDEALRQAFIDDQDIHATTAAAVNNIPLEEVTRAQRSFAKAVNFGLMYGMGAYRLARDSDLTLAEAEDFITAYFERFPKVRQYLDETKQKAAEQGYLETLLGRRRYFPALQSTDPGRQAETERRAAEREAVNYPIQGGAADLIKIAMLNLYDALHEHKLRGRMILQVHDELVLEVPEDEAKETAALVKEIMENAYPLDIPLRADVNIGHNWGEAK